MKSNPRQGHIFWAEKLDNAIGKYSIAYSNTRLYLTERKLKKIPGHGLNDEYTGYKLHKRRAAFLKNRLVLITKAAKANRECKRIKETKIKYFLKRLFHSLRHCYSGSHLNEIETIYKKKYRRWIENTTHSY